MRPWWCPRIPNLRTTRSYDLFSVDMAEGTSQRPLTPLSQAFLSTNTLSPASSPLTFHSEAASLRRKRSNFFPKLDELNGAQDEEMRGLNIPGGSGYLENRYGRDKFTFSDAAVNSAGMGGSGIFSHNNADDGLGDGSSTVLPSSLKQMLDPEISTANNPSAKPRRTRLQTAWKEATNSAGLSLRSASALDVLKNSGPATTSLLSSTTYPFDSLNAFNEPSHSHVPNSASSTALSRGMSNSVTLTAPPEPDEETIPTAIVIKNIPFSLKKEVLFKVFTALDIPRPYAFNYHFDNGVFRGLAFANFHSPEEAKTVVQVLNGYEITGRRLRVEWKRQLPPAERERVERGKQEKRAVEERKNQLKSPFSVANIGAGIDFDLNDPAILNVYSHILLFYYRSDNTNDLVFDSSTTQEERRVAALLASRLNLNHSVTGDGEAKQVVITMPSTHFTPANNSSANHSPLMAPNASTLNPSSLGASNLSQPSLANHLSSSGLFDNGLFSSGGLSSNFSSLRRPAPSMHLADSIRSLRGLNDSKAFSDIRSMPATPLELATPFANLNVSSPLDRNATNSSNTLNGSAMNDYFASLTPSNTGAIGSRTFTKN